jgi:hypothetical protein
MSVSRSRVGCLLFLIVLSISVLNHHQVLYARHVKGEVEHQNETEVALALAPGEGRYAAVNRQVPSSPDPLHNK